MKLTKPLIYIATTMLLAVNETVRADDNLLFNFGISAIAGNYNSLNNTTISLANAIDSSGNSTAIGLTVSGWNQANGSSSQSGNATSSPGGTAAAIFSSVATASYFYGQNSDPDGGLITLLLTGLDNNSSYSFTFFNSRTGVSDNRDTQFQVVGGSTSVISLNAANNTSNVAVDSEITPDINGDITVYISKALDNNNSSGFFYINAFQLDVTSVPEPSSMALMAMSGAGLMLTVRRLRQG